MRKDQRHLERKPPDGWRYYRAPTQRRPMLGEISTNVWRVVQDNAALVAALLALFGVLITGIINTYIAEQGRKQTVDLEEQRAQEASLQTYLSDVGDLLLNENLRNAQESSEVGLLVRAKTVTVSLGLDGRRKRILLSFLNEQFLINKPWPVVSLEGVDLSDANLSDTDLSRTVLSGTNLANANLADGPDENDAAGANLANADLQGANLTGVDFSAANLRNVDYSNARGVTLEQLEQADTLEGATMPNGQTYEDWLQSKGSGEDGENSGPS